MSSKRTNTGWKLAFSQFLKTTTLHGFKYLSSNYYMDRVGWLTCCCASACCAALLVTVLWARFLEVPALLVLSDRRPYETVVERTPDLIVCAPVEAVAGAFVARFNGCILHCSRLYSCVIPRSNDTSKTSRLPRSIARVLRGKRPSYDQFELLDELLKSNNMSLKQAMYDHTPPCERLVVKCRWQDVVVPCHLLFVKEITPRGVCCVMHSHKAYYRLHTDIQPSSQLDLMRNVELAMQCSNESMFGCEFLTKMKGEEIEDSLVLYPGFNYMAHLRLTTVPLISRHHLFQSDCDSSEGYSRSLCMVKCAEKSYGCSDPLRVMSEGDDILPPCSLTQLGHIRALGYQMNVSCECLPSCDKVTTIASLESNTMDAIVHAIDPIYECLDASTSTVLFLRVIIEHSHIFTLVPTETWFTLLSSLGGVFNMFLGVGLFTAIEILFLLFFKLPFSIKKCS